MIRAASDTVGWAGTATNGPHPYQLLRCPQDDFSTLLLFPIHLRKGMPLRPSHLLRIGFRC